MTRLQLLKNRFFGLLFAVLLFGSIANRYAKADTWDSVAALSGAKMELGAEQLDGKLFAVGGWTVCSPHATVEAYDPATDTWTPKAPLPTPRGYLRTGVIDGKLYAVGGAVGCGAYVSTVEAYDPATNSWATKASLPAPRIGFAAGVVNGILYAVGGLEGGVIIDSLLAYDPATDSWSHETPMPTARYAPAVVGVGGLLYVIGGANETGVLTTVEAYDPQTDTWTTMSPMPTARAYLSAGVVNGIIYAAGGTGDDLDSGSKLEAYEPHTNTWLSKPSLPTPRYALAVTGVDDTLYALGGACPGSHCYLNTVDAFTPDFPNHSPVAHAGTDQVVNATSPGGASVMLNGTGSMDPDGDQITFSWVGPFGGASGATPTVSVPVGTHIISLTVTDILGATSTPASVVVTVRSPTEMTTHILSTIEIVDLQQAVKLLHKVIEHITAGNIATACNQLQSFSNMIQAQSGKQLTSEEANLLRTAAYDTQSALGCLDP